MTIEVTIHYRSSSQVQGIIANTRKLLLVIEHPMHTYLSPLWQLPISRSDFQWIMLDLAWLLNNPLLFPYHYIIIIYLTTQMSSSNLIKNNKLNYLKISFSVFLIHVSSQNKSRNCRVSVSKLLTSCNWTRLSAGI